jgi:hypothetical protein
VNGKDKRGIWSRRDFFSRIGWGGFGVFAGLSLIDFIRSAFPRVHFQPRSTFKAGLPSDYATGEVRKNLNRNIVFGSFVMNKVFTPSLLSVRISDAPLAGSRLKTNSSAPVTAAGFIKTG